jgi:flagellar hook-associated protein 3 FlgL
MRVTNMVPDIQYQMQQSEQSLAAALQQVSTSKRVNQLSDDPAASAAMVRSLSASASVDRYSANTSLVTAKLQAGDSALASVVTSLNQAIALGTTGASSTTNAGNRQGIAGEVQGILSSVISQANVSYQGVYLFGGSMTQTPPFVDASMKVESTAGSVAGPLAMATPLTAGSTTTIYDAATGGKLVYKAAAGDTINTLATAITNAVSSGTLSPGTAATINSTGNLTIGPNGGSTGIAATTTDPALGAMNGVAGTEIPDQYIYVGNSTVNSVQVGDTLNVQTNVPGNQVFTSGANVIGSLNALITALQSGTTAQIGAATTAVSTALNYVGQQRVPIDNTISQLNSQDSYLSQESLTLTTQQTSLVGVDIAQAATNLSQAELVHSAVLAVAAKVLPQTLLDYLK